jgi:peptidylprolyl isomerase
VTKLILTSSAATSASLRRLSGVAVALAGGALVLAGCTTNTTTGGDATASPNASTPSPSLSASHSAPASQSATESPAASVTASPASTAKGKKVYKGVTVTGGKGETPTITLSDSFGKVAILHTVDLYRGTGEPVVDGSTVTVNYVGVGGDSKAVFDSSFSRGEPATFPLSRVIEGWSEGLIGMQPGGRRVLIIPGDMAYGSAGNPPSIGPDETLVFVVDMLETSSATPSAG